MRPMFADRRDAGRKLADAVERLAPERSVVLALPRGGVPVGYEVARRLGAPIDVLLVRKIGAPGHEEFGIGAVVDGREPRIVIDSNAAAAANASEAYLQNQVARELAEIERRRRLYRAGGGTDLTGRTAIVVDDGIATGNTVRAALEALAETDCEGVVLAVPVAPRDALATLAPLCDAVVCLAQPTPFRAVGVHYGNFEQTGDEEVMHLLAAARAEAH